MTPKQKLIVQATYEQIQPNLLMVTERFYSRLFRQDESLEKLFNNSRHRQAHEFSEALSELVRRLDDPRELSRYLRALAKHHEQFNLSEEHYVEVGKAYVFAIRHALGGNFNRSIANAWNCFFREIGKMVSVDDD